jgi:hypothetical protein
VEKAVKYIATNPTLFARMLSQPRCAEIIGKNFLQNLLYHVYPYYLPPIIDGQPNSCLLFLQEVIDLWNYSIKMARPAKFTAIDEVINCFTKAPEIVCYVEKISLRFMKELNKCKLNDPIFIDPT